MGGGIGELDPVIHERVRLGILTYLLQNGETDFNTLKNVLEVTDGNLSRHLRVLEEEGILQMRKIFVGRRPRTYYTLTPEGKKRFRTYLENLENLLKNAMKKEE